MTDVLKRTGWLVLTIGLAVSVALMSSITAHAQAVVPGVVKLGNVELTGSNPGTESEDLLLSTCDAELNYFGFEKGESLISTVTFQNITPTPVSILESPATPQFFEFTGSGDITVLAGTETYPLVLSGPAVDGLGYHIKLTVTMSAPISDSIPNTVYINFWIPEVCEETVPVEPPVVPEEPVPGVVASAATTTTPSPAAPASLPATGSNDTSTLAATVAVASIVVIMSVVLKRVIVKFV